MSNPRTNIDAWCLVTKGLLLNAEHGKSYRQLPQTGRVSKIMERRLQPRTVSVILRADIWHYDLIGRMKELNDAL